MTLSFASIPLLLHDPAGSANQHIRKHIDERLASIFSSDITCYNDGRNNPRLNNNQTQIQQIGLPRPTYPEQPSPKINTLYWPSGATRWAQGLFLIDGANLAAILATMTSSGGLNLNLPQTFIMSTPELGDAGVNTPMYLLPPRPVSPPNIPTNQKLWLLPIVDARYFWQNMPVSSFRPTTWASAFTSLSLALGVSIYVDSIPAAYGIPDPVEWQRDYENAAMLLDAAAVTIGMRFVADWSLGSSFSGQRYQVLSQASSLTAYNANNATLVSENNALTAGGDFSSLAIASITPANVLTTFRNASQTGVGNTITVAATGSNDLNQTKVFHTTITDWSRVVASSSQSLANQLAADFNAWLSTRFDSDIPGIFGWHATGFDDCVIWEYGVRKGRKNQYIAQTRVQSLPYNFGYTNVPVQPNPGSSSSSNSASNSNSGSSGASGSGGSGSGSGCITVVTSVSCGPGGLTVTYGSARGC